MESSSVVHAMAPVAEPAKKIYVLDTNVLLHDPTAVMAFNEHHIVIPMTVLEELDHIKDRRDKTVSREARIAIQMIDKIVDEASPQEIQEGVAIVSAETRSSFAVLWRSTRISSSMMTAQVPYLNGTPAHANDNRIINVALKLQVENEGCSSAWSPKDINMRIKAKGSGLLHVEDYRRDRVLDDIDLLSKGYEHIAGDFWSSDQRSRYDARRQHDAASRAPGVGSRCLSEYVPLRRSRFYRLCGAHGRTPPVSAL
jgi:PhoH-like ATPase